MRHVKAIQQLVESGQLNEAHDALEDLLAIGPNNIEALKLLASLYRHQGRFEDEEQVWRRTFEVDQEDEDVLDYFQKVQIEDREHYYFTDILPDGGRRFLAYPRSLVNISIVGLLGCLAFLFLTRLSGEEEMINSPGAVLVSFCILVVSPWIGIIYTWARSLRSVEITRGALEVATRFRAYRFRWDEIDRICLAYSNELYDGGLKLVILPRQSDQPKVAIDFSEKGSSIRARRHLINEIKDFHSLISHEEIESLGLSRRSMVQL